ncbi:3-mercaptopyruvate sulfurtransferase [Crenothrix sp. D3]|nr:3-mercaptopyruvate sulfurtransferase [Crenothrix sp. D3]
MSHRTLISASELQHFIQPDWVIIDCRFSLTNSEAGSYVYRHGHIPNARYAHLDNDLSSRITDRTGRHPLPDFNSLVKKLGAWGVKNNSQVVVYDDAGGAFAGRLWWLLRALGHDKVAVLDGGIKHWQQQYDITTALPRIQSTTFRPYINNNLWLTAEQVENQLARKVITLIDARTPERYRGEQEPIDPVAGHIPYALNRAFQRNLDAQGLFLAPDQLRAQFQQLIGDVKPEHVVHYCGSGVTACHNVLAMEHAGLLGSKLYAGSWSEWIRNKNRAVATCC